MLRVELLFIKCFHSAEHLGMFINWAFLFYFSNIIWAWNFNDGTNKYLVAMTALGRIVGSLTFEIVLTRWNVHNNEIGWSWQRSVALGVLKGFLHVEQPQKFYSWNVSKDFGHSEWFGDALLDFFSINVGHDNIWNLKYIHANIFKDNINFKAL